MKLVLQNWQGGDIHHPQQQTFCQYKQQGPPTQWIVCRHSPAWGTEFEAPQDNTTFSQIRHSKFGFVGDISASQYNCNSALWIQRLDPARFKHVENDTLRFFKLQQINIINNIIYNIKYLLSYVVLEKEKNDLMIDRRLKRHTIS